jgi:phage recombination protein Bet
MSESHDLTVVSSPSITKMRRQAFNDEQIALIRATVAADCNPAELALFLETCARHELDPFIKEVWAIRWQSSKPVQTVVSKDGLLKVANRCTGKGWAGQPGEFLGVTAGAVHEHDLVDIERTPLEDGRIATLVTHKPRDEKGEPTLDNAKRGALVGAWAVCRRRGHDDVFFYASRDEYDKKRNAWQTHPHAMMVKVADSIVLRKAFPISGVVGEGELDDRDRNTLTAPAQEQTEDIRMPEDEELAGELTAAFKILGYRRAKVRALVNACGSTEDYRALLVKLHEEADREAAITEAEVVSS